MKTKSLDESARRYYVGMSRTPYIPCKHCGKKTRAWWGKGICEHCGGELPYPSTNKIE